MIQSVLQFVHWYTGRFHNQWPHQLFIFQEFDPSLKKKKKKKQPVPETTDAAEIIEEVVSWDRKLFLKLFFCSYSFSLLAYISFITAYYEKLFCLKLRWSSLKPRLWVPPATIKAEN